MPYKTSERKREYYAANREKYAMTTRAWIAANRERYCELQKQYRLRHPERIKARSRVATAIKQGKLVRGDTCHYCGKALKTHAHHHNGYAPEFWLDVIWLCQKCHHAADKADSQQKTA